MDIKVKFSSDYIVNISYKDIRAFTETITSKKHVIEIEFKSGTDRVCVGIEQGTEMEVVIEDKVFKYKDISKVRELYYLLKDGESR